MSDLGFNIWGVITSTLGLLALLPFAWLYTQLPSKKLCSLERLLKETEEMFNKGLEDGLHTREQELYRFHSSIWAIKLRIDDFRCTIGALSGWFPELSGWWGGLSDMISTVHRDVRKLRADLIDSSSRDRKRLAAAGYASVLAKYSGVQSQERRSTILSYAARADNTASFMRDATIYPRLEDGQYPLAPRMEFPPPILEHDTSRSASPVSFAHAHSPEGGLTSGVTVEPRQDDVQYPLAPRPESPSPILEHGASRSASPDPRSPAHPPVGEDHPSVSNAVTHDLALNVIDALHARRGEPGRGRRVERRDVLHRFGRHLLTPAPAARPHFTCCPSERSGDARHHLGSLSEVLPSYYQSDVVVLQGDGGVVHLYLGPFEMVGNGYACNSEHDSDDENDA